MMCAMKARAVVVVVDGLLGLPSVMVAETFTNHSYCRVFADTTVVVDVSGDVSNITPEGTNGFPFPNPIDDLGWWEEYWPDPDDGFSEFCSLGLPLHRGIPCRLPARTVGDRVIHKIFIHIV